MKQRIIRPEFSTTPLNLEEQRELVNRVVSSRTFSTSETLRAFLLYAAERSSAGDLEALKEQQIGSEVLGRRPDYNPAEDNIVRVRARQLRQRLDEYFNTEGVHEPFLISIPKGHYVLCFTPRPAVAEGAAAPETVQASARTEALVEASVPAQPRSRVFASVVIAWTVAACALIALAWQWQAARRSPPATPEREPVAFDRKFWTPFFSAPEKELKVITADSGVALWQDLTRHSLSLGDYISRSYLQGPVSPEMLEIAARRYTSPADVGISLRVADIARGLGGRTKVVFARAADIADIRNGNLILLGSRRSNPWLELFEPRMNFVLDASPRSNGPRFRNRSPKPGEQADFEIAGTYLVVQGSENKATESYALAALLPNSTEGSRVLLFEGLNMEGTEAAAEFVTNSEKFAAFLKKINVSDGSRLKSFEVILKLTSVGGGYANPDLVAYRYSLQ